MKNKLVKKITGFFGKERNPKKLHQGYYEPKPVGVENVIRFYEEYLDKAKQPEKLFDRIKFNISVKKIRKNLDVLKKQVDLAVKDKKKINSKTVLKSCMNIIKHKSMMDSKGWSREIGLILGGTKNTYLIFMELRNGKFTHMIVRSKTQYFDYEEGRYFIDDDFKYYDISVNMWCLDYHQDCALPLKRKFDVNKIIDTVANDVDSQTETSINPKSFKIFMESDIIQKVIKGAEMDQWLAFVKTMLIVIVILNGVTLAVLVWVITHRPG